VLYGMVATSLLSCSDCDEEIPNENAEFAATYRISSWISPASADLNSDGVESQNLLEESTCYGESRIELKPDGTFLQSYSSASGNGNTLECLPAIQMAGIWSVSEDRLTTTAMVEGTRRVTIYMIGENLLTGKRKLTTNLSAAPYPVLLESGDIEWHEGEVMVGYDI